MSMLARLPLIRNFLDMASPCAKAPEFVSRQGAPAVEGIFILQHRQQAGYIASIERIQRVPEDLPPLDRTILEPPQFVLKKKQKPFHLFRSSSRVYSYISWYSCEEDLQLCDVLPRGQVPLLALGQPRLDSLVWELQFFCEFTL
ncbi:MAG: hypothetical protein Q8P22_14565 [Chloroflexota bacterium]|nr:hypothetical protein [Chloroflexota bacterium]